MPAPLLQLDHHAGLDVEPVVDGLPVLPPVFCVQLLAD